MAVTTLTGSTMSNLASTLNLVRKEVDGALDQAAVRLEHYAESANAEDLKGFLSEIQQVRGTFKMLDFRAGERLCEELADTGRTLNQSAGENQHALEAFSKSIMVLKRYVEMVANGQLVAPGLLLEVINDVRKSRQEKALPNAYFFMVNLRPKLDVPPAPARHAPIPYRRVRQLFQIGLLGVMRNQGRKGALNVMGRAVSRIEKSARGQQSWGFWYAVKAALEALNQEAFEIDLSRVLLMRSLDKQIHKLEASDGQLLSEKQPDWLLKEFLYLISLAEPETALINKAQTDFSLPTELREVQLAEARRKLSGPDQSALDSLTEALQDELHGIKDLLDLAERTDGFDDNFSDLSISLRRIADTLIMVNLPKTADRTMAIAESLRAEDEAFDIKMQKVADQVLRVEQDVRGLSVNTELSSSSKVDPLSLLEARIAAISESQTALSVTKRAIGSYVDSNNDKLHVKNVGKTLLDVSGALFFLDQEEVSSLMRDLERFVEDKLVASDTVPAEDKIEALADAISAVEYFIDSLSGQAAGATEAVALAKESIQHLVK
jgi:scaffold protein FimL